MCISRLFQRQIMFVHSAFWNWKEQKMFGFQRLRAFVVLRKYQNFPFASGQKSYHNYNICAGPFLHCCVMCPRVKILKSKELLPKLSYAIGFRWHSIVKAAFSWENFLKRSHNSLEFLNKFQQISYAFIEELVQKSNIQSGSRWRWRKDQQHFQMEFPCISDLWIGNHLSALFI